MAFSVDDIKAEISRGSGMAIANLYHVELPPLQVGAKNVSDTRGLSVLCSRVAIPGRQILSNDYQLGVYNNKIAYGFGIDDVAMTFYALNDFAIRNYFEVWQSLAVNHITGEVGYYNDYTRDVKISHLQKETAFPIIRKKLFNADEVPATIRGRLPRLGPLDLAQGEFQLDLFAGGGTTYSVTLNKAYPTTLNAIELGNDGQLIQIDVQLSYKNWTSKARGKEGIVEQVVPGLLGDLLARI